MVEIVVVKPFTFQYDPVQTGEAWDPVKKETVPIYAAMGRQERFLPGRYEVEEWFAAHWYVLPHLEGFVDPPPPAGAPDFLQRTLLASQAARDGTSVAEAEPKPAPLPPNVEVAGNSTGGVPADAHYFAGQRQPEPTQPTGISYLR